jgi:ubiquinone/menaquinone biosynthesis C-methylase UbiE
MKLGDFSNLAKAYSQSRPGYSENVLSGILGYLNIPLYELEIVDVGAGTGIWSRVLNHRTKQEVLSVEPNIEMLNQGILDSKDLKIKWLQGSAESIPVESNSKNWITMASSFHWADFDSAISEFGRVLKPGGFFTALWNPRYYEANPKLLEIENWLNANITAPRVSSGRSGITNILTNKLESVKQIEDVIYIEGKHHQIITREMYLTAWRSTNDVQVKLGPKKFEEFLSYIKDVFDSSEQIKTTYLTRSWTAKFK